MPYEFSQIIITSDPTFQDEMFAITPQLKLRFPDLYAKADDQDNTAIIDELIQLIIQHPYTPQLKNYLSMAYQVRGNMDKAKEVNRWILSEHPTYLFAKINLARECIFNKEYHKVEDILSEELTLQGLYPDRKTFHTTEMTAYMSTAIQYLCAVGRMEDATIRFNIIKDLDPSSPDVMRAGRYISNVTTTNDEEDSDTEFKNWFQKNYKKQRFPVVSKVLPQNKYRIPKFIHAEILMLYRYDMNIPKSMLKRILDLPRASLIQDLETVLADAEYNFQYYVAEEYDFDHTFFLIHATLLFGEIKATESLPKLLEIFKNNDDFLEFYYSDILMEHIWQALHLAAKNQRSLLFEFLMLDNTSTEGKMVVLAALQQFGYEDLSFLPQLQDYFEAIIDKSLEEENHKHYLDTQFLGSVVAYSLDFKFRNLMPKIKQLYKNQSVDVFRCGKWKAVKKQFDDKDDFDNSREILSIATIYSSFNDDEYDENVISEDDLRRIIDSKQKNSYPHANRNDNCPCGSGKKYKKCCL